MNSDVKDAAAIASSLFAPFVAILVYRLQLRERAYCSVGWKSLPDPDGYNECAVLVVHNRSDQSVAIKDVRYKSSIFRNVRGEHMALYYEDPSDIDFPYIVEPDKLETRRLDEHQAIKIANSASWVGNFLSRLGWPRIWVQIVTTTGKKITVPAEGIIPWRARPSWLQK